MIWSIILITITLTCQHTFAQICHNLDRNTDIANMGSFMSQATSEGKDIIEKAVIIANERAKRANLPNQVTLLDITLALVTTIEVKSPTLTLTMDASQGTLVAILKKMDDKLGQFTFTIWEYVRANTDIDRLNITNGNERELVLKLNDNPYASIDLANVTLTEEAHLLLAKAEEAKNEENTYRQNTEHRNNFSNSHTSPEHILLAFIDLPFPNPIRDFFFTYYTKPPTRRERWLGGLFDRYSPDIRRANEVNGKLYQAIGEVRGPNNKNGVREENPQYQLVEYVSFHPQTQQQSNTSIEIPFTENLNRSVTEIPGVFTDEKIRELANSLSHNRGVEVSGEDGVGRRTLVDNLIYLATVAINDPENPYYQKAHELIPENLRDHYFLRLNLTEVDAGTKYRGVNSEHSKQLVEAIQQQCNGKCILLIDNPKHFTKDTSSTDDAGSSSTATDLMPYIRNGTIRFIVITNTATHRYFHEHDSGLGALVEEIQVPRPNRQEMTRILDYLFDKKKQEDAVLITEQQKNTIISRIIDHLDDYPSLGDNIKGARELLSKVFDAIREIPIRDMTTDRQIQLFVDRVTSQTLGDIPIGLFTPDNFLTTQQLKDRILETFVAGPEHTNMLDRIANSIIGGLQHKMTNNPHHPILNLLFIGPTAIGKTELVEAIARSLSMRLITLEGANLKSDNSRLVGDRYARLRGSSNTSSDLVTQIRDYPDTVIYFTEVNLAHRSVLENLESILNKGMLEDVYGQRAYFERTIVILDLNPSDTFYDKIEELKNDENHKALPPDQQQAATRDLMIDLLRDELNPEPNILTTHQRARPALIRRIGLNHIYFWNFLNQETARSILSLKIQQLHSHIFRRKGISIEVTQEALNILASHVTGRNRIFGMQSILDNANDIFNILMAELTNIETLIENNQLPENTIFRIEVRNGQLFIEIKIDGETRFSKPLDLGTML